MISENMKRYSIYIGLFFSQLSFSQGILNNGALIVTSGAAQIYIAGNGQGGYTSQAGGQINPSAGMVWTMEGNWFNNSVNTGFGNDNGTVILNGANETIGGSSSTTFYNLTLQGTGTKTQLINTNVGGVTTRTGVLSVGARIYDLNSFTLTVTNPAISAVTYGTGYILSETNLAVNPSTMNWYMGTTTGGFVYPFGVAGTQIPFTFNKTTAGSSTVAVSTRATVASDNQPWEGLSNVAAVSTMFSPVVGGPGEVPVVVDRWWDIYAAAPVTANCTFSYRGIENTLTPPYNTGNLGAQHWNGSGWDPPVGSAPAVSAGVGAVTANGLSTFSPWVLSALSAFLPIDLVDFTAKCNGKTIYLSWITATEKNNDHFTIERSYDGKNFTNIATVKAFGNSNSSKAYNFSDATADVNKTIYYRLLQTDLNGTAKICKIITSESCSGISGGIVIQNTREGQLFVEFSIDNGKEFTVDLIDILGRKVRSEQLYIEKGYNRSVINTSGLPESYYMMLISDITGEIQKSRKVYVNNNN